MKIFLDTNVLASAFATRGLCADVLRHIVDWHELVIGEVVIEELREVLKRKFGTPAATVAEVEAFLRGYHVEPKVRKLPDLRLSQRNDILVVASAAAAGATVLVTGDREILELDNKPEGLQIMSPRDFWNMMSLETNTGE